MNKIIKLLDHTFLLSKPPYTIVDLGCNKGNFYNACVKTLGEANIEKYIGVEPNEYLYKEHLSKLVSHNVIMLNAAVTGKTLEFVKLGKWSITGIGAVVLKDVPDYAKVVGNPARIIGQVE
jgi:acetyltransferase-like isoleucine patch superfamily enzyme